PNRSSLLADVPTLGESGATGYNFETWFMVFAPANTPKPIIEKLNTALNKVLTSPEMKERLVNDGFDPIPSTPEEARARLEKEMVVWHKLIKERGIKAD